ncbi:DUF2508 family protein [Paenibacillus sp. JX-17]|uniref:DUF2508 family protein n=1 Tax=Paenibacillus lacisoli TaxID=3064525 RepID=A0ABT9CHC3_9BACL|nr:DUF2508 family protein [Paenibacillus sp. JX-17]MDO7908662.1 DUF2508 family protein [Paenibacillus sp. JX-17]
MAGWRSKWFGAREQERQEKNGRQELYDQIVKSQREWERAYQVFHEASGTDEIDYAIFALEAAERKYQMFLRQAKRAGLHRFHVPGETKVEQNG